MQNESNDCAKIYELPPKILVWPYSDFKPSLLENWLTNLQRSGNALHSKIVIQIAFKNK